MIKYRYTEEIMKNRSNKVGIGIISLALALALPLNANATEANKLIKLDEVNTEKIEQNKPDQSNEGQLSPLELKQTDKNTNYISQQGLNQEEEKIKVTPQPVGFREETKDGKNYTYLSYEFEYEGDHLPADYTISVFALKNSQVKNIKLVSFKVDSKEVIPGKEMAEATNQIESEDILGFKLNTVVEEKGSVRAEVEVVEGDLGGDYSLYYVVTRKGQSAIGKMDIAIGDAGDRTFYVTKDEVIRDYEIPNEEKEKPFENLPFTKYLLNDTDEEKKLSDFVNLEFQSISDYILVISYINPTTLEAKAEEIENPEEYVIPANSLGRFDLRKRSDGDPLIKSSEISTSDFNRSELSNPSGSLLGLVVKKDQTTLKTPTTDLSAKENLSAKELIEEEKNALRKANPNLDEKSLEIQSLSQAISKQNQKLENLIGDDSIAGVKNPVLLGTEADDQGPSQAKANALKLLEEQKKSILELNPDIDQESLGIMGLTQAITVQNQRIEELIQQAFLNYELDSLIELEKTNPEQAKEEYKKIYELVKQAQDTSKKADDKLIELDEINLIDNATAPLLTAVKGAKPVLNLGMLTPLTKINNLTKDSPKESERDFSTNLEKKLKEATKKVETVTIGEKEDKKADKKDDKAKENKDNKDPNKKVIVVDKKAKENQAKTEPKINTPIFVKYLQTLNSRGKLLDNK